ncbi:microfibril-associated glycoprotein 4-like [Plectropomus leopardus]|uniref:microfibril-associated glycoprotein 4-like n=1 Tax=Plectropomus leopardus TaxID=160734 RepID=UPI001C4CB99B|nr:microfibril-associated glycoprotein 4-like [Plectropomus leopardus]
MMMMMQVTVFVALLALVASDLSDSQFYLPIDCDDIYRRDNTSSSGVYTIYPGGPTSPLHVYCDMDTDGGRWTVFQRRIDGTENFFRPWSHYKTGFGNTAGEYWLGLENIFLLTVRKKNMLRVDMEDWQLDKAFAQYASFSVGPDSTGYQLHLGAYNGGSAGDALAHHNKMMFTTFDKDQDGWDKNCARHYLGAFWYNNCHNANPNGMFAPHVIPYDSTQIIWNTYRSSPLKTVAMKIRPASACACTN